MPRGRTNGAEMGLPHVTMMPCQGITMAFVSHPQSHPTLFPRPYRPSQPASPLSLPATRPLDHFDRVTVSPARPSPPLRTPSDPPPSRGRYAPLPLPAFVRLGAAMTSLRNSPALVLIGFVLLLGAMFGVAYAVGSAAGPVAPGLHRSGGGGSGGMDDMDGMENHGMGVLSPAGADATPGTAGGAR